MTDYDDVSSAEFDAALDRLSKGDAPTADASTITEDDRRLLQMAQLIRGGAGESAPSAEFIDVLQGRISRQPQRISRRTAVLSSLGALAAGIAAGFGLNQGRQGKREATNSYTKPPKLVGPNGEWTRVAAVEEVPEGAVKSFTAGAIAGYVTRRKGVFLARSRVCTHMGCLLDYQKPIDALVCPCHGAVFGVGGSLQSYPDTYVKSLPALPKLDVHVEAGSVLVRTI